MHTFDFDAATRHVKLTVFCPLLAWQNTHIRPLSFLLLVANLPCLPAKELPHICENKLNGTEMP